MLGCHVQPEQMFNLIFGYNGRYVEEKTGAVIAGGTCTLSFTPVPSDEVWVLQGLDVRQETATRGYAEGRVSLAGVVVTCLPYGVLTVWVYRVFTGVLTMAPTDFVTVLVSGGTVGDAIRAHAWGYKMKLAQ